MAQDKTNNNGNKKPTMTKEEREKLAKERQKALQERVEATAESPQLTAYFRNNSEVGQIIDALRPPHGPRYRYVKVDLEFITPEEREEAERAAMREEYRRRRTPTLNWVMEQQKRWARD